MTVPAGNGPDGRAATCTKVRNSNPSGVRESNRVSNWLFRMVALLAVLLNGSMFYAFSNPVEFKQSIPASGSIITSFNFELEFDIEKALEAAAKDAPGTNVGIGYMGSASATSNSGKATLYKGDEVSGEELGMTLTSNFTGKSEGFTVNGNKVKMVFDENIPIIANQEYTIVVNNIFYLYKENAATRVTSTKTDFHDNPIILKFIGADVGESKIFVEGSNVESGIILDKIKNIEFYLSSAFTIKNGAVVKVLEGENIISSTDDLKVSSKNEKSLLAEFSEEIELFNGHKYSIVLPAEAVALTSNINVGNSEFSIDINGSLMHKIALASSKVDVDFNGIPTAVTFIYDLPDGTTLDGMNITGRGDGLLSVDGSEEFTNLNTKYSFVQNGKGLKWDLSSIRFEPATKYNFIKEGSTLIVFDANNSNSSNGLLKEYLGENASISFVTPSIDECGFSQMEFIIPKIKTDLQESSVDYTPNMGITKLHTFITELSSQKYVIGNQKYDLTIHPNAQECKLYEVNGSKEELLKTFNLYVFQAEDKYGYFNRANVELNVPLYEGKNYKLVIPEGYFTIYPEIKNIGQTMDLSKCNYVKSKEMVYTFEGAIPAKSVLLSCNLQNNAVVTSLYNVIWTFEGEYHLSDDITTVTYQASSVSGVGVAPVKYPVTVSNYQGKTMVMVDFVSRLTGEPLRVNTGTSSTIILPKGIVVNTINGDIVNDEVLLTIKGGQEVGLQKVNVNLTVNGLHTASHSAIKGERYSLALKPVENWTVESVRHGDKELASENGVYTTDPLNEDANITATLAYDGLWAVEHETTGVWEIADSNVKIYSEESHIVVAGAQPGNRIAVYTAAGLLVGEARGKEEADLVRISVAPGQVYIVTVDGVAAKLRM